MKKPESPRPAYYREVKPNGNRRAFFHDYQRPGHYLITIGKAKGIPDFSTLTGHPTSPVAPPGVALTPTGSIISNCMELFLRNNPMFEFQASVIMPDHLHIVWHVKTWIPRPLSAYIGALKSCCTKVWAEVCHLPAGHGKSLFNEKFNDKIAFTPEMLARFVHYVNDNPRRLLVTRCYPAYFQRRMEVIIADTQFHLYGNFNLLRHPLIAPVVISRTHTEELRLRLQRQWGEITRSGGVLVSPFISKPEKEVLNRGLEGLASVIRLIPEGLPPKYKPSGEDFELCSAGRIVPS